MSFKIYNASAGSGKTFTLVKEYLKLLLETDEIYRFQHILAITFTNKAADEMKERVLGNLAQFAAGQQNEMLQQISAEVSVEKSLLCKRAKVVLEAILHNYSRLSITTIDSFTHRLIRSFSYDLGLPLSFEVELDSKKLLEEAVALTISKIGIDTKLTETLINFSLSKLDDDTHWDITSLLNGFSLMLLSENDAEHLKILSSKSLNDFDILKNNLTQKIKTCEKKLNTIGKQAIGVVTEAGLELSDFYRSMFTNHFLYLSTNIKKAKFFDQSKLRDYIEENIFYAKSKSEEVKQGIESILPELLELYSVSEEIFQQYTLYKMVHQGLVPLAVLKNISQSLDTVKEQHNVQLLAAFNQIISNSIKNQPVPFIYEKLGEKYNYFFIDEMQDTSQLQWQNLVPLINNALAEEKGQLLLVGDAKQAIYRWRGGDASQFIHLSSENNKGKHANPFFIPKERSYLITNYRSYDQVVGFNNNFFMHLALYFQNPIYGDLYSLGAHQELNGREGGFVQLSFLEKVGFRKNRIAEEDSLLRYPKKVFKIIQGIDSNFKKGDICVLVRKKKEGIAVAKYLSEQGLSIVSSETLLLQHNPKVSFVIDLLKISLNEKDKNLKFNVLCYLSEQLLQSNHAFITNHVGLENELFFEALRGYGYDFNLSFFSTMPFYEGLEYCIQSFKLLEESDAYIQYFLDFGLEFQQKHKGGLLQFLEHFEQQKYNLSIVAPKSEDAIQIMTIHKAKGLEFPVVIFPCDLDVYREQSPTVWMDDLPASLFNGFETVLLPCTKNLSYTGEKGQALYNNRRETLELDNYNLLYVALTRAVEQLYIITEKKINIKGEVNTNFYSGLFINFLKQQQGEQAWEDSKLTYRFGSPYKMNNENIKIQFGVHKIQDKITVTSWKNHSANLVTNSMGKFNVANKQSIATGNAIHTVMSMIKCEEDIQKSLEQAVLRNVIDDNEKESYKQLVFSIVRHVDLKKYFNKNNESYNEKEVLTIDKEIVIPDRLVFENNQVVIIDYKTGVPDKKHQNQIEKYAHSIKEMGYAIDKKILVYIKDKIDVQII